MKPFYFHPTVLLRVPYFAYTKHKSLSLQESMDQPAVRNAQLLAAPAFYDILKKSGFKEESLNGKQRQTIENYLNRMHYRCTPFGLFAGTLPVSWSDKESTDIVIGASRTAQTLPSFGTELMLLNNLKANLISDEGFRYFSNPANVLVGNEMRYLAVSNEPSKDSIREYKLKSIAVDKSFKEFWAFCNQPLKATDIIGYLSKHYDMDPDESTAFFHNLIDEQILLSDIEPNITGTAYSNRLSEMPDIGNNNDELLTINALAAELDASQPLPEIYEATSDDHIRSNCYAHVNMRAQEDCNTLENQYQQKISEGLYAIQKILPDTGLSDLESFKIAFINKFDQRCVPLSEALDPELGINYAGLSNAGLSNAQHQCELLDKLDGKNIAPPEKNIQWSAVHTMLLQQWQSAKSSKDTIFLDDAAIEKLPLSAQPLPPSMSAIFKILNGNVFLEHIGGVTANAILGRFSLFHKEVETCCAETSNAEAELNPGVIFAEIASIQDSHAANIEKRKHFYHFEIPVLTTSLLPYERQLQLNDLYLMVRQGRIILFSAKYGKEVIPRLSTAFNYKRSTLGIYRFLCDMQFQGTKRITPFQMDRFFPDLPFYPRVIYKNAILHLATWHIKKEAIQHALNEKDKERKVKQLFEYLNSLNIPAVFALKEHDNQLIFKINDADDLLLFADNIKNSDTITIEEFPFTEAASLVKDEDGHAYQHQFVAMLINGTMVYKGNQVLIQQALSTLGANNEAFMPGSNWVYLKIYCHPGFANTVLLKKIKPLLKQIKGLGEVEKWFFVRYTDPEFHIRVRIFIPPMHQGAALELLHQSLKRELNLGLISRIQLDTYKPEWERYSHHLLPATEDCFYRGSEWILQLLQQEHRGQKQNTAIAVLNIHAIFEVAATSLRERQELLQKMYQSLSAEHGLDKQDQIELGVKFRNYRERMSFWLCNGDKRHKTQSDFEKSLQRCFLKMERSAPHFKNNWIADLIHMQLNRTFTDQPRKQEMVIYYLMTKWYLAEEKKSAKALNEITAIV